MNDTLIAEERVLNKIYLIREQKVMLDMDLAELYGVETKQLKRAVRRNSDRFPEDFMFELDKEELEILRSQIGTSSWVNNTEISLFCTQNPNTSIRRRPLIFVP